MEAMLMPRMRIGVLVVQRDATMAPHAWLGSSPIGGSHGQSRTRCSKPTTLGLSPRLPPSVSGVTTRGDLCAHQEPPSHGNKMNPDDLVFVGWDIRSMNLADAMIRAKVLDIDLQKKLRPYMESIVSLPAINDPNFIDANQGSRANNVIKGTKKDQTEQVIKRHKGIW